MGIINAVGEGVTFGFGAVVIGGVNIAVGVSVTVFVNSVPSDELFGWATILEIAVPVVTAAKVTKNKIAKFCINLDNLYIIPTLSSTSLLSVHLSPG